jgi:hypothetical protein
VVVCKEKEMPGEFILGMYTNISAGYSYHCCCLYLSVILEYRFSCVVCCVLCVVCCVLCVVCCVLCVVGVE